MNIKYKLVIPSEISKGLIAMGAKYQRYDGQILPENIANCVLDDCLIDWLKEIKQPMTFDKYIEENHSQIDRKSFWYGKLKDLYEWTVENERLKHEPKQSFQEWFKQSEYPETIFQPNNPTHQHGKQWQIISMLEKCHEWTEKNRGY